MKYLFLLILIFSSVLAQEKKEKSTIGLGPYIQTQPYKDVFPIIVPSPVVFFDNGIVYARWTRFGLYFLGEKNDDYSWAFSLTAQPRPNNYKASDSNALLGMEDKKSSVEAGLAFSIKADKTYFEIMVLSDILDRYDSWIVKSELGYEFKLGNFSFYPSAILMYQSSEFINYYYGVKQSETTLIRPEYQAHNGMQLGVQTYIEYPLSNKLSAFFNIRADKLSQEASNSPIVNDDYIYSGLASLIYTFEY